MNTSEYCCKHTHLCPLHPKEKKLLLTVHIHILYYILFELQYI